MQLKMEIILQLIWPTIILHPTQVQTRVPVHPAEAPQVLILVPAHPVPAHLAEAPQVEDQPILEDQAIAEGLQVEVPTIVVDHPEEAHPVEILDQAVAPVMDQVL